MVARPSSKNSQIQIVIWKRLASRSASGRADAIILAICLRRCLNRISCMSHWLALPREAILYRSEFFSEPHQVQLQPEDLLPLTLRCINAPAYLLPHTELIEIAYHALLQSLPRDTWHFPAPETGLVLTLCCSGISRSIRSMNPCLSAENCVARIPR